MQAAKEEAERQQVGVRTVDEMSTQEVIQEASKVQDASLNKVKRMQQTVEESRQVGAATAIRLKGQTEQLKNIDTDIMKVKSNLSRADLLLRAFMRKMMTDKLIMGFMLLIFIGIVVIVIYKMVGPDKADEGSAPTSVVSSTRRQLAALDAFHALLKRRHSEES